MTSSSPPPASRASQPISRNLVFSTLSAASAGLLLGLQTLATRHLSIDDFGKFSWALTFALFGEALMDLGLHQLTIRSIARDRNEAPRLLHNSLALKAVPAAVMVVVMSGLAFVLKPEFDARLVTVLMLGSAVVRSYLLTIRGVLLGLERFDYDSVVVILDRALVLAVGAAVLLAGGGLYGLTIAFLVARIGSLGGALLIARRLVGNLTLGFDTALWRDLQRRALPLGVFLIVLTFYSYIDTVMLGAMRTDAETALYRAAYTVYEGLSYAPAVLSSVLTPRLSNLWRTNPAGHRHLARRGLLAAIGLAIALGAPVIWLAAPILSTAFGVDPVKGVDYGAAEATLRILVLGLPCIFTIWMLQAIATSTFDERLLLRTTAIGAFANAGLNFIVIPLYGREGAALATLVGECLTTALLAHGLRRRIWGPPPTRDRSPDASV